MNLEETINNITLAESKKKFDVKNMKKVREFYNLNTGRKIIIYKDSKSSMGSIVLQVFRYDKTLTKPVGQYVYKAKAGDLVGLTKAQNTANYFADYWLQGGEQKHMKGA